MPRGSDFGEQKPLDSGVTPSSRKSRRASRNPSKTRRRSVTEPIERILPEPSPNDLVSSLPTTTEYSSGSQDLTEVHTSSFSTPLKRWSERKNGDANSDGDEAPSKKSKDKRTRSTIFPRRSRPSLPSFPYQDDDIDEITAKHHDTAHGVEIIDTPTTRVHHPTDLLGLALSIAGVLIVIGLSLYAHATTQGVTADLMNVTQSARNTLVSALMVPIQIFQSVALLLMPFLVLVFLALRRNARLLIEAICAVLLGLGIGWIAQYASLNWAPTELKYSLEIYQSGQWVTSISLLPVAVSAMLTVAGPHGERKIVSWNWNCLWISLVLSVVTGGMTVPAALLVVLLGRIIGLTLRYISGVQSTRAQGADLVNGIRRAGVDPIRIARIHDITRDATSDAAREAVEANEANRIYAVTSVDGERFDVIAFDGDRQLISWLTRAWRTLRLRALESRSSMSLRQLTERTALLGFSANTAGVRTPQIVGISQAADSMLIVQHHPTDAKSLRNVDDARITDDVVNEIWRQLEHAHEFRIAHRALSADSILLDPEDRVWITSWDSGDVASSPLSRRLDVAQTLVVLGMRIGVDRAVASARQHYSDEELAALGPALQAVILPAGSRQDAKDNKETLDALRTEVVKGFSDEEVQPVQFKRSWGPFLMAVMSIFAVWILVTTINFDQIIEAVTNAEPWWFAASLVFVLLTYLGAALALVGFAPIPLPLWKTVLVEVAASFVNFVAPAGVGPAALNLRFLTQRKVKTSLAVATVALVQISGFVVTVVLLLVLVLFTGQGDTLAMIPSRTIFIVLLVVAGIIGVLATIPKLRTWAWNKIMPTVRQIWPRLTEVLGHPVKLTLGLGGNLIMTIGYLVAFWCSIKAFGYTLSPIDVALIYLVGNTIGSLIPTPGGLGGVEAALWAGLSQAGIPAGVGISIAVLFRVVSYWLRIPLGWFATQYLQKKGEI